ncbi:MAG: FAD-dependent oxidoreductase [Kaiparowitsia implicata GSE-PSE-MK54-09C]|jgi:protoporphyrinogen oxidase|nr:FAD-dependent oxidoreductase [Kaiparowitsia implicata GSE-PSE-MK54-09C]
MVVCDYSSAAADFSSSTGKAQAGQAFVVLGGGIAGLAAARELLQRGCSVTLIEKGAEVGGLARTFEAEGFRFDIGGHRFHSNNPSVVQWLKDLLKEDLLLVPRISHIHLNGQFANYPIQFPGALSIFSPLQAVKMVLSYAIAKLKERDRPEHSFEDWVIKRYGKALYNVFFKPYTEKVWGIPATELASTWASQRIRIPSMWKMVKRAIKPPKVNNTAAAISQFYYPRSGFGRIPETLKQEILQLGGIIHASASLYRLEPRDDGGFSVTFQSPDGTLNTVEADQLVSTIPINYLLEAMPAEYGSQSVQANTALEYRDIICLFVALNKPQVSVDSWTYFPSPNLIFGRTHEPKNWSPNMVPSDQQTSLAIEIFANQGESIWNLSDDEILDRVVEQMNQIGWINKRDVHKGWVLRVPYAYPVYRVGYEQKLQAVKDFLGQWPNLHLVGRTGSFHYMNSDGVIEDVFRFIEDRFPEAVTEVKPLAAAGRWM